MNAPAHGRGISIIGASVPTTCTTANLRATRSRLQSLWHRTIQVRYKRLGPMKCSRTIATFVWDWLQVARDHLQPVYGAGVTHPADRLYATALLPVGQADRQDGVTPECNPQRTQMLWLCDAMATPFTAARSSRASLTTYGIVAADMAPPAPVSTLTSGRQGAPPHRPAQAWLSTWPGGEAVNEVAVASVIPTADRSGVGVPDVWSSQPGAVARKR